MLAMRPSTPFLLVLYCTVITLAHGFTLTSRIVRPISTCVFQAVEGDVITSTTPNAPAPVTNAPDIIDKILELKTIEMANSTAARPTETSASALAPVIENIIRHPANTSYFMCGACKASYLATDQRLLTGRGMKVRCGICEKEWFQTPDRVLKTDEVTDLETMSNKSVNDLKRVLADRNWPKYPRINKQGIFVGNLPYTFDEKEIADLFSEYGLTSVSLVRDNEGQSKGFAFVEVASEADAELLIKEMHWFYTDSTRRLTVRSAQQQGEKKPFTPRAPSDGQGGDKRPYTPRPPSDGARSPGGTGGGAKPWQNKGDKRY
jgi:predicted Zn finger-like uncharacterized protein